MLTFFLCYKTLVQTIAVKISSVEQTTYYTCQSLINALLVYIGVGYELFRLNVVL